MFEYMTSWEVMGESSLSDHKYIKYSLTIPKQALIEVRPLKKADWNIFQQELEHPWDDPPDNLDNLTIESVISTLYERINKALDIACPKKLITESHRLTWWTTELDETRNRACRAHHLATTKGGHYWTEYNLARREHKYEVRAAKRKSWREFTSNTDSVSAMAKLNKIIHYQQNKNAIGLLKKPNQMQHTQSITESLQLLMSEYFPDSTPTCIKPTPQITLSPPLTID
jgi:hypothetical protein